MNKCVSPPILVTCVTQLRPCSFKVPPYSKTKVIRGHLIDSGHKAGPTGAHLQHQPQLSSCQVVRLVEHAVELDHVGVVGQRAQDVILGLDLLVHVLESAAGPTGTDEMVRDNQRNKRLDR